MEKDNLEEYITSRRFRQTIGIGTQTLRRWREKGFGPMAYLLNPDAPSPMARRYVYKLHDVQEFVGNYKSSQQIYKNGKKEIEK